jgi:hypothetical protein
MQPHNLAFYTYFYGSNNNPAFRIPELPSLKYKCYYYTNNSAIIEILNGSNWIGIYHDIQTTDDLIESCMVGKRVKTMPHEYSEIKDYDYLCFLDSKLQQLEESLNNINVNNNTYRGFVLEIVEEPYSPTVNRRKAIAKNTQGIILLSTPLTFSTENQVLIEEIKLLIDSNDLKAD